MKKILIATNWEVGQSNVCLAVAHALVQANPTVEVHFASFEPVRAAFKVTADYAQQCFPEAKPIVFHKLAGLSMVDSLMKAEPVTHLFEIMSKPPILYRKLQVISRTMRTLLPWSAEDFVEVYDSLADLITNQIKPDLVVVDCLFSPGLTVCAHLKVNHIVISPNTVKDFSVSSQPRGGFFWKYPGMATAFAFPVPWYLIPVNIFLVLAQIFYLITDKEAKETVNTVRKLTGGAQVVGMQHVAGPPMKPGEKRTKVVVGCRPEIDLPLEVIPDYVVPCGPIVRAVKPVAAVDPDLDVWLKRGPTVFLALGSHIDLTEKEALEVAKAFKKLFDAADERGVDEIGGVQGQLQVFWKLQKKEDQGEYGWEKGSKIWEVLGREMEADRLRITKWVKPEPAAVMQTGNVVCVANHGGANSYYDAVTAGVPQVSLPVWFDCYDFGSRVEILNIGKWGNKRAMPRSSAEELGSALIEVVLERHSEYKASVSKLAAVCNKVPGAEVAAVAILAEVGN